MTRSFARYLAFGVDALVALMVTGLVITPLAYVSDLAFWQNHNPAYAIWALVMIFLSLIANGETVGKRWAKLRLSGNGCLVCRELRRMGPFLFYGFAAMLQGIVSASVLTGVLYATAIWIAIIFLWPALRGAQDFPHNTATHISLKALRV
ncbi:MAG: hypothetical protein AAF754_08140 [Pseudomonadota bacterium]